MKLCVRTSCSVPHTANQPVIPDVTIPTTIGTRRSVGDAVLDQARPS